MNYEDYSKLLSDILSSSDGRVILINGPWGIGKTFFWEKFSEEYLSGKKNAYISLFGKTKIEEIQSEALVQIFSRNKIIEKCSKITEFINTVLKFGDKGKGDISFGITGSSIGLLLSLVKAKELKDVIVCLDDFERKSSCLKIEEVMGYSSILSDRYGCKVILIMDEAKIDLEEKMLYDKYKEKVVDLEVKFNPNQSDVVKNIIQKLDKKYQIGVTEAVEFASLTNLRIIKKTVCQLELLDKQLDDKHGEDAYVELGFDFTLLAYIYYKFGKAGLCLISGPDPFDEESSKEEDYEVKLVQQQLQHRVSKYSDLDNLLWDFFETMEIDVKKLKEIICDAQYSKEKNSVQETIYDAINRYTYDVNYNDGKLIEDLFPLLEKNKDRLIGIFPLDGLLYVFGALTEVSHNDKFDRFKDEVLQNFVLKKIEKIQTLEDLNDFKRNDTVSAIASRYDTLRSCVEKRIVELENNLKHGKNINKILLKIPESRGWSPEDVETLDSLSSEFISNNMIEDSIFFASSCDFVRWCNRYSGVRPFDEFCKNVEKSIVGLGEKSLGVFRFNRIKKMLNLN